MPHNFELTSTGRFEGFVFIISKEHNSTGISSYHNLHFHINTQIPPAPSEVTLIVLFMSHNEQIIKENAEWTSPS